MARPVKDIDRTIEDLYNQGLAILTREMKHISQLSIVNKLDSGPAKDLRDNIKLLSDMKKAHKLTKAEKEARAKQAAKSMSEEQLKQLVDSGGKVPKGSTNVVDALSSLPPTAPGMQYKGG